MFQRHHRKARALFALSDIVLVALAFQSAYQTRLLLPRFFSQFTNDFEIPSLAIALLLGSAAVAWVAIAYWNEIYDRLDAAHPRVVLRDTFKQCALGGVALVVVEFLLRFDISRPFVLLFLLYSFVLLCCFRINARHLVGAIRREFSTPYYVVIVGLGERAVTIGRAIEASAPYAIHLRAFLDTQPPRETLELEREYPVWDLKALPQLLASHVIDEVIFAVESERLAGLEDMFLMCDEEGVRTRVAVDFFPHVNSQIYLDRLDLDDLNDMPLLTFAAAPHDEVKLFLKRIIDVAVAGTALLLLSPLLAFLALLIRLTSRGPAVFRQERLGLSGRRFTVYKFRSMVQDAEEQKAALEHLNTKQTAFKIRNDPRMTAVGRWLRKFSLDELPQLWNVVRGDMSIVGPRPAVPNEVERYERWQRRRLRMRPGLTCLWALKGRDALDFETWMRMDMEYIDSWSLGLDWMIMLRTIPQVLLGKGAH
ncbi:MAG: exopolysaccharide biosynthesis polyprenyl glycosylphosphotransferase [Bryobacteraceae bacterium]|nr:exopolysaccharide biosynthesis polyprenyl glycosylphosphotransferase [Bryobacteraceae bacterium]